MINCTNNVFISTLFITKANIEIESVRVGLTVYLSCLPGWGDGSQRDAQIQEEVRDHSPLQAYLTLRTKTTAFFSERIKC